MTAPIPQYLADAVLALVAQAYQAGRADAAATAAPAPVQRHDSYTVPEAAKELRIGLTTVNALIASGELASFLIGRRRYVYVEDLEAYRDSLRTSTPATKASAA